MKKILGLALIAGLFFSCSEDNEVSAPANYDGFYQWQTYNETTDEVVPREELLVEGESAVLKIYTLLDDNGLDEDYTTKLYVQETRTGKVMLSVENELVVQFDDVCSGGGEPVAQVYGRSFFATDMSRTVTIETFTKDDCSEALPQ